MVKIIADTSTLFNPVQGAEIGIDIAPLSVAISGKSYTELVDIDSSILLDLISKGGIPASSQPPIGKVVEILEKYPDEEILGIFMCDGLSGTYQSAVSAKEMVEHNNNITIIDSKTLCGPHRYLAIKAAKLASEGKTKAEILTEIEKIIPTSKSFLLPQDFDFLKRGGRLTPLAATLGGLLKIVPIMTQTEDRKKLEKFAVGRTFKAAVSKVIHEMEISGVDDTFDISISHAGALKLAQDSASKIKERILNVDVSIYELSPAFVTQGGPGCIAIQWIKK